MMLNNWERQKTLPLQKSSKKFQDIVLDDPKVKVRESAEAAGMSIRLVVEIWR